MLAPIRSSVLRHQAQGSHALLGATATSFKRCMTTQEERWTPATAKAAEQSNLIPDSSGKGGVDLSNVVPNIEARWPKMSKEEQYGVFRQLEELQRKDWKELSIDQKKAAYFISFGPHGPRKVFIKPGQGIRTLAGVSIIIAATTGLFFSLHHFAHEPPKTMTTEYQEQMTERARDENRNPITGISSEGYKGQGYVQKSVV